MAHVCTGYCDYMMFGYKDEIIKTNSKVAVVVEAVDRLSKVKKEISYRLCDLKRRNEFRK